LHLNGDLPRFERAVMGPGVDTASQSESSKQEDDVLDIVLMALHQKSHEIACLTAPPTVSHKGGICRWVRIKTKKGRRETKCCGDGHAHKTISQRRAAHKFVMQAQ